MGRLNYGPYIFDNKVSSFLRSKLLLSLSLNKIVSVFKEI